MSGAETDGVDEFEAIARLLRPLSEDAPEALQLMDDAALVRSRPGFELVVSADAMVEGVHFLPDDPLDLVARKLLRANLSDLAAKAAEPYAYLLTAAWPGRCGWPERALFARGLGEDQARFGLKLIGGDTSSTPGPLALSVTILGWAPEGGMVRRSGASMGDLILVTGSIGDGWLGLKAARGELAGLDAGALAALAGRYRLPEPRVGLIAPLRRWASASADVSDGLIADAGHIAEASGVAIALDLDRLPLSEPARTWLDLQPDRAAALADLAAGGDDYEIVLTASAAGAKSLLAEAGRRGLRLTAVGEASAGEGVRVSCSGREISPAHAGWRHR